MATDPHPRFTVAMFDIYRRAKSETGYNATVFLGMITKNFGLATAKTLINAGQPSDGYTSLHQRGRLDLTVEAVVVENPEWRALFTPDELAKAEKRLRDHEYSPKLP